MTQWPRTRSAAWLVLGSLLVPLWAGAGVPQGPQVVIAPEAGKPPDLFAAEQDYCRSEASALVEPASEDGSVLRSAVVGTLLGAVAGSVLSGRHHDNTAMGAVAGLAMGAAAGSNQDTVDEANAQRRFDAAYTQCMLAKGNGAPRVVYQRAQPVYVPAPSGVPPDYAEPGVPPDYVPPGR
ncbi:MAG: hypothetical protein RIR09_1579 [Pseudomonadota bacterium]|jgi:hypothetical protein